MEKRRIKRASTASKQNQASGLVDRLLGRGKGGPSKGEKDAGGASSGGGDRTTADEDDYMARKMASSKAKGKADKGVAKTRTRGSVGARTRGARR
jgi:hypothetical protein